MRTGALAETRATRSIDLSVVAIWVATRLYVLVVGLVAARGLLADQGLLTGFVSSWDYFDTRCYASIVEFGYLGSETCTYNTAYFPGLPLLMWLGGGVGLSPAAVGLIVSATSALFAGWALSLLAREVSASAEWTVAAWMLAPMAVFLFAPYTEALFAALSFWAWVWARRGNWWVAGLLAGAAGLVRSNALFLAVALVVMFLLDRHKRWIDCFALLIPFLTVGAFFVYLYALTGDWLHWVHIQADTWNRQFTDPFTSAWNTIVLATTTQETGFAASRFIAEFLNTFITVALGVVVVIKRWWPEAIYVFLTMWSMTTGEFFQSTPRATLVLFPIWLVLGVWLTRYPVLRWVYLPSSAAALALITSRYVTGQWIA